MSSRFMRMVVMFDLPVETREQRKIATKFRKYLLDEGYVMMQFSVYYRICNGKDMVNKYLLRLEDNGYYSRPNRKVILQH